MSGTYDETLRELVRARIDRMKAFNAKWMGAIEDAKREVAGRDRQRTAFIGPDGVRELSTVPTSELRAWLERSDRMLQTPDTPVMQDDVRAELTRREVPTAYVD
jgi:hypothetical protein